MKEDGVILRPVFTWNQPICGECFAVRRPELTPQDAILDADGPDALTCCDCGCKTSLGIYYRVDPNTVRFPARDE